MYSMLVAFFLFSIVFSFLCSLWTAVLLSITPAYAEISYQQGSGAETDDVTGLFRCP